jgi:hypothetical protein
LTSLSPFCVTSLLQLLHSWVTLSMSVNQPDCTLWKSNFLPSCRGLVEAKTLLGNLFISFRFFSHVVTHTGFSFWRPRIEFQAPSWFLQVCWNENSWIPINGPRQPYPAFSSKFSIHTVDNPRWTLPLF